MTVRLSVSSVGMKKVGLSHVRFKVIEYFCPIRMYHFYQTQNFSFRFIIAVSEFQVFTFWPIKVLKRLKLLD